ncbi:MAG TPA: hydrolase [Bacillota bacterium]|nr:hydrolase [Bacillota bacterium]
MSKQTYYISLSSGGIHTDPTIDTYDYIIEANDHEISELQKLFEKVHEKEGDSYFRSHIPFLPYHEDKPNFEYDQALKEVYSKLYKLGNDVCRRHIESMRILEEE